MSSAYEKPAIMPCAPVMGGSYGAVSAHNACARVVLEGRAGDVLRTAGTLRVLAACEVFYSLVAFTAVYEREYCVLSPPVSNFHRGVGLVGHCGCAEVSASVDGE